MVEDDQQVAISLQEQLTAEGYEVEHAISVSEALAKIGQSLFDVAVLDLHLGQADGLTVLSRLRQASPHTAAVVLTGDASTEHAVQALRVGVDDFLFKPSQMAGLLFALPAVRNIMPGVPSVGALSDFIVLFWALGFLVAAMIWVAVVWMRNPVHG